MTDNNEALTQQKSPQPSLALQRLEKLVGTWDMRGQTLDAKEDNISGQVTIEWLPGGFFLQQRGEMEVMGFTAQSLEIVGYDPATEAFSSHVYSSMGETAAPYHWDIEGDVLTHWNEISKYTGTFSEDGNSITGGWRPIAGQEGPGNIAYDVLMFRVK